VVVAVALAAVACAAAARVSPAAARPADALTVYGGRGSWLDIFAHTGWTRPASMLDSLEAHGVGTLYLETGNYSQTMDVVRPRLLGTLLHYAHAAGLHVVAWYLPSLADPATDARRALAAVGFRSAFGDRFDGFALDIEASVVRDVALRNRRLLALSRVLRGAVGADYPLGAIIPSPVGMERHPRYWPSFPYRGLAGLYDAFLPMAYFSYYVHTGAGAYAYTRDVVSLLRRAAGEDVVIHVIGGVANRLDATTVAGFVRAADECAVDGLSLYAFPETSEAEWQALATEPTARTAASRC
jgi:hypothetical protein